MRNIEYLSASSITSLYDHYDQWFDRYVLELPQEDNIYMSAGSAIHNLLEEFYSGSLENNETIGEYTERMFTELFKKHVQDNDILNSLYDENITEEILYKWLFEYIQTWLTETVRIEKKHGSFKAWLWNKPKYSEFEFKNDTHRIYGFIDAIFTEDKYNQISKVGTIFGVKDDNIEMVKPLIRIEDYKTSSKQQNTFHASYVIQLYIYALAMHEYGHRINWVAIDYLKYNSKYFFPITQDVLERTKKFIKYTWDVVNEIKSMSVEDAKNYKHKKGYKDFYM